jgi:hypothetical protein
VAKERAAAAIYGPGERILDASSAEP